MMQYQILDCKKAYKTGGILETKSFDNLRFLQCSNGTKLEHKTRIARRTFSYEFLGFFLGESKIAHNIFLSIFPQARDEAPRKSLIKTAGYKLSTQQGKPCHHQLITDSQVRHKSSTIKPLSCRDNSIHASQHIRKTQTTSKRANVSPRTSSITRSSTEMRAIPAFDSSLPIQKPSYTNFCLNNSANLQIPN